MTTNPFNEAVRKAHRRTWDIQNFVIAQASPDEIATGVQDAWESDKWTTANIEDLMSCLQSVLDVIEDERRDQDNFDRDMQDTMQADGRPRLSNL